MSTPAVRAPALARAQTDTASRRPGLTAAAAVAVAVGLGLVGAIVDVLTGPGLRTTFAVCFVVGCGLAALGARRQDLLATVIAPPLVYAFLAVVGGVVNRLSDMPSVQQQALELATSLIIGAPVLLLATAVAALIAAPRALATRP